MLLVISIKSRSFFHQNESVKARVNARVKQLRELLSEPQKEVPYYLISNRLLKISVVQVVATKEGNSGEPKVNEQESKRFLDTFEAPPEKNPIGTR